MQALPRINLDRVQFIADFGVNWRTREEAASLVKWAKSAGFGWVGFSLFDAEYMRELRGDAMKAVYQKLMPHVIGLGPFLAAVAREARIMLSLTALTPYVVDDAMRFGGAIRVPLERTGDQAFAVRWARAKGTALGMYETMATWPSANTGRMPLFVAPGHPAKEEFYEPYWKSGNLRGRLGVAFHTASRDLFVRAAIVGSPMISIPMRPVDYADAPDKAIATVPEEAAEWIREVVAAGATE